MYSFWGEILSRPLKSFLIERLDRLLINMIVVIVACVEVGPVSQGGKSDINPLTQLNYLLVREETISSGVFSCGLASSFVGCTFFLRVLSSLMIAEPGFHRKVM